MNTLGRTSRVSSPNSMNLFVAGFHDAQQASDLFDEFLQHAAFDKSFCVKLLAVAKHPSKASWDVRRLAMLMLEHQILKLDADHLDDFDFLFTQLSLKRAPGPDQPVAGSVLKEGYATTDFRAFVIEFKRRLERLNRVHHKIQGSSTTDAAIRDFIETSRRDCKLTLGRYLFTPQEVVDEILSQLQITPGVKDLDPFQPRFVQEELTTAMGSLPEFEARILRRLCETSDVYWVSDTTSAEINSMVEYPLTTVVVVIKPPGSDLEFELKRAGRKGRNSLSVVFARNGYTVPPTHRLDGGSMQWLLRYETNNACKLSFMYRHVHGVQESMAGYISRSTIYSVPARDDAVQTLTYFTDPHYFGDGYRRMRVAMSESINAFAAEGNAELPDLPGDLGLTVQFIGHVSPAQSILCGTSSFRLDRLGAYLSSNGPVKYFKEGLGVEFSKENERQLADELLDEVLGVYHPPDVSYQEYEQYLDAALSVAENRARADRAYLSLVQQIAKFWGTLLGIRGHSRGESFVPRNVGLKSFWDKGQWNVKIIFMDHDALCLPDAGNEYFYVLGALPNMKIDERYIWDRSTPERFTTSEVGYLQRIYRISKDVDAKGHELAADALRDAYKKTQRALLTDPKLQPYFNKRFIERLLDWDTVVHGYFETKGHKSAAATWRRKMKKMLDAKRYKKEALDSYVEIIEKHRDFLERYSYLYKPEKASSSNRDSDADDLLVALASR